MNRDTKMHPTAERVRSLLIYNRWEEKEPFRWQSWLGYGVPDSRVNDDGHLEIEIDGSYYLAEQLAWLIMTGDWPEREISHADSLKLNNTWNNLELKAPIAKAA